MKISNLFFIVGFVALSGVVLAQDEADSVALKEYFNSQEGLASEERGEKLRDFVVTPDNSKFSETTSYTLEFSVSTETFYKIVNGYMVFYFPEGFGLSELTTAGINTDFGYIGLIVTKVETEVRFVIINYFKMVLDTLWDSTVVPERVNFDIRLHKIVNPSRTKNYKIAGAAITDHRFVAGPTWSESFEITEESQETKAGVQIISTELVAPNSPKVNTGQAVAVEVLVANVSAKTAHNVSVGLSSDGESIINSPKTIEILEPNDTAAVSFEIAAGSESGTEKFTSDILSGNVIEIEAVDDTAGVIIQRPAFIVLSSNVEDGDSFLVSGGEKYEVTLRATNIGESSITSGKAQFDHSNELIYSFHDGTKITTVYQAPLIDTTLTHSIKIIEFPIDINSLAPAKISDTEIQINVKVKVFGNESFEGSFVVENNPFNPNNGPVSFVYNLQSASDVEFNIYTVTGEEVYSRTYLSGSEGGKSGTNQIQWDGRNSDGEMVLNGVYVTTLNVITTGEKASLKLAVLK